MDIWTPYANRPPLKPSDILYNAGEGTLVDVFAIHGLRSNADSAWTYRNDTTEVHWLKEILPKTEGLENIRVAVVNHQTRWDANTANMKFENHAVLILDEIESLRMAWLKRPIIFIAHSFGRLLIKMRSSDIATLIKGILFLGVPHSGTRAAFGASLLSCTAYWRGSSSTLLEYMAPEQPAILELESNFRHAYVSKHSNLEVPPPYVCNFLEMRSESFQRFTLWPTVSRKSGDPFHGDVVYLDTDHRGLNKFRSQQDPNFIQFLRSFNRAFDLTKQELHGRLRGIRRDSQPNILALYGPGGIGKTQIAIEYAHRHHANYSSVFWIDATNQKSAFDSFLQIAKWILRHYAEEEFEISDYGLVTRKLSLVGLLDENGHISMMYGDSYSIVEVMKDWFAKATNTKWLLIFDNIDDLEAFDI
ncbi:MAG: hypothetical protein M1840_002213 [Geoglossum simile]|nr:MAG: hypothetical protein M1840_002213 [Geoglossum simile]